MTGNWLGAAALSLSIAGAAVAEPTYKLMTFADLADWENDDHQAALRRSSRPAVTWMILSGLASVQVAKTALDARAFFEAFFQPVMVEDGEPMLFTGYFEPELRGAPNRGGEFQHPIYRLPDDYVQGQPYLTRREIEETGALSGQGLEIAWLADPVDLFFLQVQGSGRIRFPDGGGIRVGYGGKNGQEYSSVGRELIARGTYDRTSGFRSSDPQLGGR